MLWRPARWCRIESGLKWSALRVNIVNYRIREKRKWKFRFWENIYTPIQLAEFNLWLIMSVNWLICHTFNCFFDCFRVFFQLDSLLSLFLRIVPLRSESSSLLFGSALGWLGLSVSSRLKCFITKIPSSAISELSASPIHFSLRIYCHYTFNHFLFPRPSHSQFYHAHYSPSIKFSLNFHQN